MNDNSRGASQKKADVILNKTDNLLQQSAATSNKVDAVIRDGAKTVDIQTLFNLVDENYRNLSNENAALRREIQYLSAQVESVYESLSSMLEKIEATAATAKAQPVQVMAASVNSEQAQPASLDVDELASRVAAKIYIPTTADQLDYDKIGVAVANNIHVPEALVEDIDLDALAEKLKGNITVTGVAAETPAGEFDYDKIGVAVANNIHIPEALVEDIDLDTLAEKISNNINTAGLTAGGEADYDKIGVAVANNIHVPEALAEEIDIDALAEKIATNLTAAGITSGNGSVDYDKLGVVVASNIHVPNALAEDIDIDALAKKLTEAMPVQEVISPDYIASKVAEQIIIPQPASAADGLDVEELSRKVADKIVIPAYEQAEVTIDEDKIADAVIEKLNAANENKQDTETVEETAVQTYEESKPVDTVIETTIDEHALADEIADRLNVTLTDEAIAAAVVKNLADAIDNELIADCVAKKVGSVAPEQFDIMIDDDGCDALATAIHEKLDYDALATKIVEKIPAGYLSSGESELDTEELAKVLSEKLSVSVNVNEDEIADKAAAVLSNYLPEFDTDEIAEKVVAGVVPAIPAAQVNNEEIAHTVAQQIVENQEDKDFDIVLDDEGIEKITQSVSDEIKNEYAERFDKIDSDIQELKDLIESGVAVKEGTLATAVAVQSDDDKQYDIVVDDEGIDKITQSVSDEIKNEYGERFDKIDSDIQELKDLIANGVVVKENENQTEVEPDEHLDEVKDEIKEEYTKRFDKIDDDIEELKRLIAGGVIINAATETAAAQPEPEEEPEENEGEEEQLVTVSDIVEPEPEEEAEEEGEEDEDNGDDGVIEDIVDDIDERYADGEIMPDGIPGISDGVDFASMMKYNRSFIARIIQGTDDQKRYYGEVKNALLSYKKVNSNVAWGAERFNKGRETIARFKIRGKTLCLYLALDPNEYKTSVYHHTDVTENKSMHGTPMMVKIKSPLGVKKAIRLIDDMLAKRDGIKQRVLPRDYAAMYPYETIEELIDDGLVKDVSKK